MWPNLSYYLPIFQVWDGEQELEWECRLALNAL